MSAGVLAAFATESQWTAAHLRLLEARIGGIETYSPAPPSGSSASSALSGWVAAAGLLGALAGFGVQVYADTAAYPLDIGGRPDLSWPSFVPIAFEIGALCAVVTGFFGFFIINRLPRLYDPIDACVGMRDCMRSHWVLAVRSVDASHIDAARRILCDCEPTSLEDIPV
jgi:hypothetical protein